MTPFEAFLAIAAVFEMNAIPLFGDHRAEATAKIDRAAHRALYCESDRDVA